MAPSCGLVEGREGGKGRFRAKKTCAPPKSPETGPNRQGTWLFRERQRAWCRVPIFRARADGLVCPPRCCSSACAWPQGGYTALIRAAFLGYTAIVEVLIKGGANLDIQDKGGDTALIVAIRKGHTVIAEALIKAGADLNLQCTDGWTALIEAASEGHTATVEALIKAGANLDLQDEVSDSRTLPPSFCLKIKDFFMIPWTLARAVGGYLVARNLGPKWLKKCPKMKPCRLNGGAVPLVLS